MNGFILTLILVTAAAQAKEIEINCTFEQQLEDAVQFHDWSVDRGTTLANVMYHGTNMAGVSGMYTNADFDIIDFVENEIATSEEIVNGAYIGVRRDDHSNIMVKAYVGDVVNRKLINQEDVVWNFGPANDFSTTGTEYSLQGLTCRKDIVD